MGNRDFWKVAASGHFKEITAEIHSASGRERETAFSEKSPDALVSSPLSQGKYEAVTISLYLRCHSVNSYENTYNSGTNDNGLGLESKPQQLLGVFNS